MAQIINTNIASLNAQRNLNSSQSANSTALERLSSGLRINSAKDDAAGLAISTKFESQTRGLNQAIRNAGDGISLAQTAEGALGSMTDNLQRVRELAVQSANATNSDEDRVALQQEVSALVAEITRTADETNFNGRNLFDGNFNGTFQIGANAGQTVDVQIGELTAGRLGSSEQVGVSAIGTEESIGNGDLIINGVAISASRAGDDTASTFNSAASAISKVAAINRSSEQTGVTAFVNDNVAAGTAMEGNPSNGTVTLNGVDIEISTSTDVDSSRASVVQAINAASEQTGIRAVDSGSAANGVQLVAEDGRNIQLAFDSTTAASTGLAAAGTYEGGYTLIADGDQKSIEISGGNGTGRGDLANAGLTAGTFSRAVASSVTEKVQETQQAETIGNQTYGSTTFDATAVLTENLGTTPLSFDIDLGDGAFTVTGTGTLADADVTSTIDEIVAQLQIDVDTALSGQGLEAGYVTVTNDGNNITLTNAGGGFGSAITATNVVGGTTPLALATTETAGVDGTSLNASALTAGENIAYEVKVGDSVESGTLISTESMAQLATAIDGEGGVSAWEEVSLTFNATDLTLANWAAGDSLALNLGGDTAGTVSFTENVDGNVTAATMVDDINNTNFGSNVSVSAILNEAGDSFELVVRNFSDQSVNFDATSAGGGTFTSTIGNADGTFASGKLAFAASGSEPVSVTLSDPDENSNFFAGSTVSETYDGPNGLKDGDLVINGVTIGAAQTAADTASATVSSDGSKILSSSKDLSGIAVAAAINEVADETGVSATVNATQVVGGDGESADVTKFSVGDEAGIYINGVEVGTVTLQADGDGVIDTDRARADALNLINQNSGKTGVVAEDNGVSLTLTASDGRNISVAIDDRSGSEASIGALFGMDAEIEGIGEATFGEGTGGSTQGVSAEALAYQTTYSTVKLESAGQFAVAGGSNGTEGLEALGLRVGTYGGGEDGEFLKDIDISTFEGAQSAITAIDNALGTVASQRAELGALQNRFESTVSNLAITAENLTAANSRIRDADFAAETAELSRTQVLQQAGISILAQANQRPQQVLSLLG